LSVVRDHRAIARRLTQLWRIRSDHGTAVHERITVPRKGSDRPASEKKSAH
jgi:hypothetical protein